MSKSALLSLALIGTNISLAFISLVAGYWAVTVAAITAGIGAVGALWEEVQ